MGRRGTDIGKDDGKRVASKGRAEDMRVAGIGSDAVKAKTGRTWAQWGRELDKAGAKSMAHKEIAAMLHEKFAVPPWWSQMVTVGYEQMRGLRDVHMSCRGDYQGSASKTINAPLALLYAAWQDAKARRGWMGAQALTVRKATENKSMRITWPDETSVEVNFYAKGADKSQVTVQHGKLKSEADVARVKKFWGGALGKLKEGLENGSAAKPAKRMAAKSKKVDRKPIPKSKAG